jgi:small basic protein (TIGR04137 family)
MSLDSSLKIAGGLAKHRNVLTRAERVSKLSQQGKFDMESSSPLNLPKVGNRKVVTAKSSKKKGEEKDAAAAGAAPAKK